MTLVDLLLIGLAVSLDAFGVALCIGLNNRIIKTKKIIFAFSFGAYEVPFLLGPTTPNALPVKAYIEYSSPELFNRPYAMVINCILTQTSR